ncbi:MAG: rhodanese-like domain-containing protein [Desulfurivibrio sp.]|jgi:predicted sulfurtransferase|nr:MAG: rhodanese-like domain-containing protein [Desulfurivibrio sp.]
MKRFWWFIITFMLAMSGAMGLGAAGAATMADVQKEAERGGYKLIATDELWGMISRDPAAVLLVDTRQEWEYAAGHIAGAVNFPMEPTWLSRLTRRGELEQFLGPDKAKHIVFY